MGKTLTTIGIGAAIIGLAFATGGASLIGTATLTTGAGIGAGGLGVAVSAVGTTLATTALGSSLLVAGTGAILSGVAGAVAKKPSVGGISSAQATRTSPTINAAEPRKTVYGRTAAPYDIRYFEWNGSKQDICDQIICLAAHAIESVDEIWIGNELAWTPAGTTGRFVGYFFCDTILEAGPGNGFTLEQNVWTAGVDRMTGCALAHFRLLLAGTNGKSTDGPFSGGLPSKVTVIIKGAKLYDPRRDSTVPGGSGPMRATDQSTWRFTTDDGATIGGNTPLQVLHRHLGWKINGHVSVGAGVPSDELDLASIAVAANLSDEMVSIASGGTEPRYRSAGVFSEADETGQACDLLLAGCCGRLRDDGGKISLAIMHNDLATAALDPGLTDDDLLSAGTFKSDQGLEETPNVARGKYTDASSASLYQLLPYADVTVASPDGMERVLPLDLGTIESASQAERVASQSLARKQSGRTFSATFDSRAWRYKIGDVVPITLAATSWNRKLWRVSEMDPSDPGKCPMTFAEEDPNFYLWDGGNGAPVQPASILSYDASNNPLIRGIDQAATTSTWTGTIDDDPVNHPKPEDGATNSADPDSAFWDITVRAAREAIDASTQAAIDLGARADDLQTEADAIAHSLDVTATELQSQADALAAQSRATIMAALEAHLIADAATLRAEASTLLAGQKVRLVLRQEIVSRQEVDATIQEQINLLGVVAEDGSAFILDLDQVKVSPTETFAGRLAQLTAQLGGDIDSKASITQLQDAIAGEQDARATALGQVMAELGGRIDAKASVTQLNQAVATQQDALAQAIAGISAEFGGDLSGKADITYVDQAKASAIQVSATSLAQAVAQIDASKATKTELSTAVATERDARVDAISQITAQYGGDLSSKADVTYVDTAKADAIGASASSLAQTKAELVGQIGGKANTTYVDQSKADAITASATSLSQAVALIDNSKATKTELSSAIATERQASIDDLNSRTVTLNGAINAKANSTDLQSLVVTVGGKASASDLQTVSAAVGTVDGRVTTLRQVVIDAGGGVTSKAMIAVDANGRVGGIYLTNNGQITDITFLFDHMTWLRPDGTPMIANVGGVLKLYDVEIDRLKVGSVQTGAVASNAISNGDFAVNNSNYTGQGNLTTSTTGYTVYEGQYYNSDDQAYENYPGWQTILAAGYNVGNNARFDAEANFKQGHNGGNGSWAVRLLIDGAVVDDGWGQAPCDKICLMGSQPVDAGYRVVVLQWQAAGNVTAVRPRIKSSWTYK